MSKKATLSDLTNVSDGIFEFDIWNGYPQTPKTVIATHRRLGSRFQYVQKLGKEANMSVSQGVIINDASYDLRSVTENLKTRVGNYFDLEYFGKTFRIILMDVVDNITAVSGSTDIMAELQITYMVEDIQ